jgi:cytochrome bd-type quinol oxidase subunit 2
MYLIFLVLGEGGQTWYGWHLFPLYPFLTILLAYSFTLLYEKYDIYMALVMSLVIGASSVRFASLIHPQVSENWQLVLAVLVGVCVVVTFSSAKLQKKVLVGLFILLISINVYTVLNFPNIYPSRAQPLTDSGAFWQK